MTRRKATNDENDADDGSNNTHDTPFFLRKRIKPVLLGVLIILLMLSVQRKNADRLQQALLSLSSTTTETVRSPTTSSHAKNNNNDNTTMSTRIPLPNNNNSTTTKTTTKTFSNTNNNNSTAAAAAATKDGRNPNHNNQTIDSSTLQAQLSSSSSSSQAHTSQSSHHQQQQQQPPLTIIVQLSGELGNNLGKLAHGLCLQEWLRDDYHVDSQLYLRHQTHPKWTKGYAAATQCFPWIRQQYGTMSHFGAGNTPSLDAWLGNNHAHNKQPAWFTNMYAGINTYENVTTLQQTLADVVALYRQQQQQQQEHFTAPSGPEYNNLSMLLQNMPRPYVQTATTPTKQTPVVHNNITLPFLVANKFAIWDACMDRYYDKIKERLHFDEAACCGPTRPLADESVFHFRNFLGEMVRVGYRLGFEELNPHDTAYKLFGHLGTQTQSSATTLSSSGDKSNSTSTTTSSQYGSRVAITTRARDVSAAQPYVDALAERNITTRVFTSSTDVHDFCFLKRAQKELVGTGVSTFVAFAALLGDAEKVRIYAIDSEATRKAGKRSLSYNWTHPILKQRFSFEVYPQ